MGNFGLFLIVLTDFSQVNWKVGTRRQQQHTWVQNGGKFQIKLLNRVMGVIHRDWKNPGRSIHLRCISNLRDFFWPIITLLVSKERSWSLDVIYGLIRPIISIIKIFTINHKKNLAVKFYPLFFTHFAMEITTWKIHISVWLLL